ncbi:vWA domain-containing protein [Streptomyces sp. NPDC046631]|jgi:hypothetical protein|uniref:vWA domain-containing protein n=1 Tax=unclassified Streptomyces TaxID=2593676 RepID=UPI0033DDC637
MTAEDIKITADRQEVHLGEEFAVLIAPRELGRGDRVVEGVAYVIAVDDSYSMEIRADSSTDEFADPGSPDDPSRKQVAEAGVHELVAALPRDAHVDVLTFAQNAGVRFSGTAGELRRRGRWNGNIEDERRWTNIEGALRRAYQQLDRQRAASRRVVLFSDGIPNFGETDPGRLAALARDAADRELHTDVIGIGAGADFGLLERLAPTGLPEHVASRTGAAEAMKQITARFAAFGRDVVAGSGELSLEINPSFPVLGVYQLDPTRRRVDGALADGGGRRPSRVRLKLGAIGAGEEGQPLYALKLRAPERISAGPMPVLKATGSLGTGSGARQLAPGQIALRTVDNPMSPILQPDLKRQIDAIELDREISGRIAAATSKADRERIYQEGVERARRIPDPDLAAAYQRASGGLRDGLDPKDVANEARAASSRSSTKSKRDWFQQIPVETPDEIRARRRRQSLDDDDDEGEFGGAYGSGTYTGGDSGTYSSGTYGSGGDSGTRGSGTYGGGGYGTGTYGSGTFGGPPTPPPGAPTEPPPGRGPR